MKTLDCASFRAKLSGLARRRRIPLRVMLELTYNCNFNCPHCYVPNSHKLSYRKRELPAARWRQIISQLAEEGCLQIGFTGGEPLLKKGFFSILRHAKRCGLETYLYTNGSLIDSQTARQLRRAGCDKADITIPAIGKSAFEKVTGAASCHQRFLRAAALLKKNDIQLGFKTCLLQANRKELPRIKAHAAKYCAQLRLDKLLIPRLDGTPLPPGLATAQRTPSKTSACLCGAGDAQCAITPAGEVKFCVAVDCPKLPLGRKNFSAVWSALGKNPQKRRLPLLCPNK